MIILHFGASIIFTPNVCVFIYSGRPECTSYTILEDSSRSIDYGSSCVNGKSRCDKQGYNSSDSDVSPGWRGTAWYRFTMPAGTRIPESSPGYSHCCTSASGWLSGKHPTSTSESVDVKFCFDIDVDKSCRWSTEGKITNCGGFFVYYLENTPLCALRYCTTN